MPLKKQYLPTAIILASFVVLTIIVFVSGDKALRLNAYQGSFQFWVQFPWLFVALTVASFSVFYLTPRIEKNCSSYFAAFFVAFGAYLTKLLFPYYIFSGLVAYDIYGHYINVAMLTTQGLQLKEYLYWPNTFILTDVFQKTTYTTFPVSVSLLSIISHVILVLILFFFVKTLFGPREGILTLLILIMVEPISIHYSPFTITFALTFILFILCFYNIFKIKKGTKNICLQASSSSFALSLVIGILTILYHAFLPLIFGIMLIVGLLSLTICSKFTPSRLTFTNMRNYVLLTLILIIGTVCWWIYISSFVFSTFVTRIFGITEDVWFIPPSSSSTIPYITKQLSVASLLGLSRFIVPALVVVPLLLWTILAMYRKKLNLRNIKILLLSSIMVITALVWLVITYAVPVGFGERFLFLSEIFLILLSGIGIIEVTLNKKKRILYALIAILFVAVIAISPITSASDYFRVYYSIETQSDVQASTFVSLYSSESQTITGDSRLGNIIKVLRWPQSPFFSNQFEENINNNVYEYSSDIIIINLATPNYVTVHGVNDLNAIHYISNITSNFNIIYENGYVQVFVPP